MEDVADTAVPDIVRLLWERNYSSRSWRLRLRYSNPRFHFSNASSRSWILCDPASAGGRERMRHRSIARNCPSETRDGCHWPLASLGDFDSLQAQMVAPVEVAPQLVGAIDIMRARLSAGTLAPSLLSPLGGLCHADCAGLFAAATGAGEFQHRPRFGWCRRYTPQSGPQLRPSGHCEPRRRCSRRAYCG